MFNNFIEKTIKGFFSNPVKLRRVVIFALDNLNDPIDIPAEQAAAAATLAGLVPDELKKHIDEQTIIAAMSAAVPKLNEWLQAVEKKLRDKDAQG